ncbi:hypothetical protein BJ741DRAFT_703049 [Chytriomyces cf. hyalinus JEL632]|nr:hypothetical protein BJ741DRAFT_703049 [Chytriomyces cf. hyalinus JEL632]
MTGLREQSEPSTHTGSPATTSKSTLNPQLPLISPKSPGTAPRPWSAASDSDLKPAVVATTKRTAATATTATKKGTATSSLEKMLTIARNGTRSEAALIGHDAELVVAKVSGWRRTVKNGKSAGSMPRIIALVDSTGEMDGGDGGRVGVGSGSKNALFQNDHNCLDSVVQITGQDLDSGVAVVAVEEEGVATQSAGEAGISSSEDMVALDFVEETEGSQQDGDFVLSNSGSRGSQTKLEAISFRNSSESIGAMDSKTVEDVKKAAGSDREFKRVSFSDSASQSKTQDERSKLTDQGDGHDEGLNTTEIGQEEQDSMNRIYIPDPAGAPSTTSAEVPGPRFLTCQNTSFALPPVFQAVIQNAILADATLALGNAGPFGHKINQRSPPPPPGTSHKRRLEMLGIVIPAVRSTSQVKPAPSKPTHRFAASEKSKTSNTHAIPATLSKRPIAGVQSWGARFPHPYLHFKNDDNVPSVDGNGLYLFDNDAGSAVNPHAVRTPGFRVLQADGRVGFEIAPMAALGWLKRIGGVSQKRLTNFGSGPRGKGGHAIGRQGSQTKSISINHLPQLGPADLTPSTPPIFQLNAYLDQSTSAGIQPLNWSTPHIPSSRESVDYSPPSPGSPEQMSMSTPSEVLAPPVPFLRRSRTIASFLNLHQL